MEQSVKKLDTMIDDLVAETGAAPLRSDPDDPWFSENIIHSKAISKIRCPQCGYYYTLPFEQECPVCEFTSGKQLEPKFHLDVDAIRAIGTQAQANAKKQAEKKPKEQKPKDGAPEAAAPEKKKKGNPPPKQATADELNTCFSHAFFQVARLQKCTKHPEADKLIVTEAILGPGEPRVLVTGLIPHYQPADLEGKLVGVITNLKGKKMKGIEGNVMLLATTHAETGKLQVLSLPEGSEVGDRFYPEGFPLLKHIVDKTMTYDNPDTLKDLYQAGTGEELPEIPKKQFEKIVAGFKIVGEKAMFYDKPLRTFRGYLTAPGIPDGSEYH